MTYTLRRIDYVERPDEPQPLSVERLDGINLRKAQRMLRHWGAEFQNNHMGRFLTITNDATGEVVEEVDQPPVVD